MAPFFISSAEGRRWLVSPHHEPRLLDRDYRGRSRRIIDDRGWCGLLAGRSLPASRGRLVFPSFGLIPPLASERVPEQKKWRLSVGKRASGSPTLPNQSIPPHPCAFPSPLRWKWWQFSSGYLEDVSPFFFSVLITSVVHKQKSTSR